MADNFYNEPNMDEQIQETQETLPEAIKIGDKAYTQEQLQELVGLGESARDLESRWNTKIDRLMPEYTKARQQLSDYERQQEEARSKEVQTKQQQGQQLSLEELKAEAARQLKDLMQSPELQDYLRQSYVTNRGAERLVEDAEYLLGDYAEQGFEGANNVTIDDLLSHMANTGIRNPDAAFKDMMGSQFDEWKMSQLQTLKQPNYVTSQISTAGSKQPPEIPTPKNRAELQKALSDFMSNSGT